MMAVVLVSAINAKTLEVKFNKAVEDTSKATVELLRGTFKQNATVKWAEDAKSVQLVGAGNFQAGDYTVNVKGLTEEALTGEVKIEAVKVASIEILSEEAVLSKNPNGFIATEDNITATVGYIVKDQYGTDITKTTTLTTNSTSDVDAKEGTVTIKNLAGKKIGDLVPVVLIHADSATTVSKTLKLSAAATVADVQVEGVYDIKGKKVELKDNTKASDVFLVINLKDQYGNDIKPADGVSGVIVTNTNPLVTKLVSDKITVKAIDGKSRFVVEFDEILKGGLAELLFIKTMDGKTFKYTVNVEETITTDAVTIGNPEFAIKGEDVSVPITVLDKEGNVITDKKILTHDTKGIKVNGDPAADSKISVKDGQVYYNLGKATTADKYETVTVQTSTFKVATVTYKVTAEAKPVAVRGFKTPLILKAGAKKAVASADVNVEDQYGRTMKTLTTGYKVAVKDITDADNQVIEVSENEIQAKSENGTATVTIYLTDPSNEEVTNSAVEQQVRVTDGKEYSDYEIATIGKVKAGVATDFTVNGILNGGKVALADTEYTATISGGYSGGTATATGGKINVDVASITNAENKQVDTEFTLRVTINATGKTLEEKFVVSDKNAVTQEAFFTTHAIGNADAYKKAKEITDVQVRNTFYTIYTPVVSGNENTELNAAVVDQYGKKEVVGIAPSSVTIVPEDARQVSITNNGKANAKAALVADVNEAKLTVTVKIGNATEVLNVTLTRADSVITSSYDVSKTPVISTMFDGIITLTGTATGDVSVYAPNATVNNKATAPNGTITIEDVATGTWNEMADNNTIIVNDSTGITLNIAEGKIVKSLTLNQPTTVTNKGTVTHLKVEKEGSTVTNKGTVTTVTANKKVTIDNTDGTITEKVEGEAANETIVEGNPTVEATKTDAKKDLENYVDEADYTTNADELTAAIEAGKTAIDEAETTEAVAKALADAKLAIDKIVSDAVTAPENALKELKIDDLTKENIKFMVKGLMEGNAQKVAKAEDVKKFAEKAGITIDMDKITLVEGQLKVEDGVISTEDWNKIKSAEDADKTVPYRITVLKGDKQNKVAKIAFYQDGTVAIEPITE